MRTRLSLPMLAVTIGRGVRDWFDQLSVSCLNSAMQVSCSVTCEDVLAIREMIEMLEQTEVRTFAASHREEDPC